MHCEISGQDQHRHSNHISICQAESVQNRRIRNAISVSKGFFDDRLESFEIVNIAKNAVGSKNLWRFFKNIYADFSNLQIWLLCKVFA